ncbi:MAG: ABC transporter ATP-binding protein [Clostridia bacterium]|nr:ABC transporter ATP-binding protein [Clostridia bacterium]
MFQLKFIWKNLEGYRAKYIVGVLLAAFMSAIILVSPYLSEILVDDAIRGDHPEWLIPILAAFSVYVLIRTGVRYAMVVLLDQASQGMIVKIRESVFHNLQHQEMRFYDRHRSGDIITRVTGDMEYIRHVVAYISHVLVESVVMFLISLVYLSTVNSTLTLTLMCVMPFILISSILYGKNVRPLYRQIRDKLSDINTAAQENIAGNRVVKAFAREAFEKEKFFARSDDFRKANLKAAYAWQKIVPVMDFFAQSMSLITLLVGGALVIRGELTLGQFTAFNSLTWALADPMRNISGILNDLQRFFASADKVIELFYARPLIADRSDAQDKTERPKGKVEFKNVTFKHGNTTVLDDASFVIEPGQTVAIMGPTGCGKTTIANLISRFYDVDAGEVLVDDVPVTMWKLAQLRSSVGIATQDVFLFSDSVDGNISFGNPEMSEEKVVYYADAADADGFIRRMEQGYETIVGERGVGLSGGQRQRIALARALAVEPPVVILDDTTSAVDMETEKKIQENLRNLPFPCTKIIIAQRISSVKDADQIFILENGKIDIGTHKTLSATNAYYRDVCELQDVHGLPPFTGPVTKGGEA